MNTYKTQWKELDEKESGKPVLAYTFDSTPELYQPEIGFRIGWNQPSKLWKPFLVLDVWHYHIQIGWLY